LQGNRAMQRVFSVRSGIRRLMPQMIISISRFRRGQCNNFTIIFDQQIIITYLLVENCYHGDHSYKQCGVADWSE